MGEGGGCQDYLCHTCSCVMVGAAVPVFLCGGFRQHVCLCVSVGGDKRGFCDKTLPQMGLWL